MKRRKFIQSINTGLASGLLLNTTLSGIPVSSLFAASNPHQDELSQHTIKTIAFSDVRMQYPRLVGKNARLDIHGYGPRLDICIITTNKGAQGWGSLRGSRRNASELIPLLVGKKVTDALNLASGITDDRYIPYDFALHDLAGVILNKPVYALLGTDTPHITKYYSGMIYFDDLEPAHAPGGIDKVLSNCQYDYDIGYRQFKLKIGRGNRWMPLHEGMARDIEVTKKVAEAFPDCDILVDGNNGFSLSEFTKYLKGISGIPLFWIEEPFHETASDYTKLRNWMKNEGIESLLADGEADPDEHLLRELMERKLLDVHLTDIEGLGFTNWRRLMPELKELNVQASPHAWGSLLKTYYTAHLAGGLGNTVTIEGVTSSSDDVDLSLYQVKDGKLIPPAAPGFGMRLLKTDDLL